MRHCMVPWFVTVGSRALMTLLLSLARRRLHVGEFCDVHRLSFGFAVVFHLIWHVPCGQRAHLDSDMLRKDRLVFMSG